MTNNTKYIFLYILFAFCITACKTPYTPAPITTNANYLVVEGLINITDSTYISLSRTVTISAKTTTKPELKATISIESNQGSSYPLKELTNGSYAAAPLNLSAANQYRLRIKTAAGSVYVSDFTPTMVSPAIDSVTWKPKNNNLEIYANTHDPKNATRYYRWNFTETWEFKSNFDSFWVSDGLKISQRADDKHIWDCFGNNISHIITLGTSTQLSQDVIDHQIVNTIPSDAEKLGIKYTILVNQYALTKEAYDYWTLLKKNTEQLGEVFDSQPSASIGNIHGLTNPTEVVIGYISAGTVSNNRIFITKAQLPNWRTKPLYSDCAEEFVSACPLPPPTIILSQDQAINYKSYTFSLLKALIPTGIVGDPIHVTCQGGWNAAPVQCVDCTLRGRTAPPAF